MSNDGTLTYELRKARISEIKSRSGSSIPELISNYRRVDDIADEDFARDIYADVWRVGLHAELQIDRQNCVEYLVEESRQPDEYLSDLSLTLLQSFRKNDFSLSANEMLLNSAEAKLTPALARVIGIAEIKEAEPLLQASAGPFASKSTALRTDLAWNSALALARMGDNNCLDRVLARVVSEDDVVIRSTVLFQDLGYTKDPKAFQQLVKYLDSPVRLPNPKNDDIPGEFEAELAGRVILSHVSQGPGVNGISGVPFVEKMKSWTAANPNMKIWR